MHCIDPRGSLHFSASPVERFLYLCIRLVSMRTSGHRSRTGLAEIQSAERNAKMDDSNWFELGLSEDVNSALLTRSTAGTAGPQQLQ